MYNVGERTPQRNYFVFPSVERPLHFNEKKQIISQTITSLNLNGKVCNPALKTRQNCATCVKLGEEFQSVSSNDRFNNSLRYYRHPFGNKKKKKYKEKYDE